MNTRITFMHRYELISRYRPMSDQIRLARGANQPRCVTGRVSDWARDFQPYSRSLSGVLTLTLYFSNSNIRVANYEKCILGP